MIVAVHREFDEGDAPDHVWMDASKHASEAIQLGREDYLCPDRQ